MNLLIMVIFFGCLSVALMSEPAQEGGKCRVFQAEPVARYVTKYGEECK